MNETTKITVPDWIERESITQEPKEISASDKETICTLKEIATHGCASGVYMPAVTYHKALTTMNEHGEAIFDFIHDQLGEIPPHQDRDETSWAAMAVYFVSLAVELWASSTLSDLEIEV